MKLARRSILPIAVVSVSCHTAVAAQQPTPTSDNRVAAIDRFVRRAFAIGATPGLGVAVVSGGRLVRL